MSRARARAFLFSFQTKLVLALTSVIVLAIFLAGTVFVFRTRDDRRDQALERVAATSPAIYEGVFDVLLASEPSGRGESGLIDEAEAEKRLAPINELADDQDVRILVLDQTSFVFHDTSGRLDGVELAVPPSTSADLQRGFVAWEPAGDFPEGDITLVTASQRFTFGPGRPVPFKIVLAVESDTIADAWLGVLPSLGLAALVAVPLSALVGIALARQVAHPVRRLTEASEAMARGDFDQRVEVDRDDELGRLARSFSAMAQRVGERDAQMRALLANVSHDLKTPMTSITGYAQSLGDGTASPADAGRIGNVIREEAEHVNRLLADLLYLAEIDAGELIRRREDADLAALLSRCVRRIEPVTRTKDVDVALDVSPGLELHAVDAEKLERAFSNVLDNAAKFTPHGGRIEVNAAGDGAAATVEIANSGEPIPPDDLPRIFDRFFRSDRARRTSGGSGLGLAIARELIELHGGRIRAANEAAGVRFSVQLPANP
jgi:signal transduction histidine kinase